MAVLFFMTIPGLAVTLVALAALDRLGLWLRGRSGLPWYRDGHRPAPAPGLSGDLPSRLTAALTAALADEYGCIRAALVPALRIAVVERLAVVNAC